MAATGTVPIGAIDYRRTVTTNNGTSWTDRLVGSAQPGVVCDAAGCPPDFYFGHTALSVDGSNNVVYLYDGAATFGGPQTVVAKRSTNGGATWSAPVTLSAGGENAVTPAVESRGNGDVRAFYYQTSGGGNDDLERLVPLVDDGGAMVGAANISDPGSGAAYKTPCRSSGGLRRLRRDRDHEHRQDDAAGSEARATTARRGLDQPPELARV